MSIICQCFWLGVCNKVLLLQLADHENGKRRKPGMKGRMPSGTIRRYSRTWSSSGHTTKPLTSKHPLNGLPYSPSGPPSVNSTHHRHLNGNRAIRNSFNSSQTSIATIL